MSAVRGRDEGAVRVGMTVAAELRGRLDEVAWDALDQGDHSITVAEFRQAVQRLVSAGSLATKADCVPLYRLVTLDGGLSPLAEAVLPLLVQLAAHQEFGPRTELIRVLAHVGGPDLPTEKWDRARELMADPVPAVRREAIALAGGITRMVERWRVETDPTVRMALLLAIGDEAASEGGSMADRAREVIEEVLAGSDPVFWVAGVYAALRVDGELPERRMSRLVDALSDPEVRPRFGTVWCRVDCDGSLEREEVISWFFWSLKTDRVAQSEFVRRLAQSARQRPEALLWRAVLDLGWRILTDRRSFDAELLPLAGELLDFPDASVRLRAANILAVLGRRAAPYTDGLAELLEDRSTDEEFDGRVGDFARWALMRIGDARALPGLVEQLRFREEDWESHVIGDPRRPDLVDVLGPLRAQASLLLPEVREVLRHAEPRDRVTRPFLDGLALWGEDALPALPEVVPFLADSFTSAHAMGVLDAIGPAAASAVPSLLACEVMDCEGNHRAVAALAARLSGADPGPVGRSGHGDDRAALEQCVLAIAGGGDGFWRFRDALGNLVRLGGISPAVREALVTIRRSDRRLWGERSEEGGYQVVLRDQELRELMDRVLALPDVAA
ncbi:hypothetical protein [Kitasatospora albolonga]|uniref:hypothetical protein n=2 Tax=Kitasatospora albolonga TaxID=68173 RepID=UPI0035ED9907